MCSAQGPSGMVIKLRRAPGNIALPVLNCNDCAKSSRLYTELAYTQLRSRLREIVFVALEGSEHMVFETLSLSSRDIISEETRPRCVHRYCRVGYIVVRYEIVIYSFVGKVSFGRII